MLLIVHRVSVWMRYCEQKQQASGMLQLGTPQPNFAGFFLGKEHRCKLMLGFSVWGHKDTIMCLRFTLCLKAMPSCRFLLLRSFRTATMILCDEVCRQQVDWICRCQQAAAIFNYFATRINLYNYCVPVPAWLVLVGLPKHRLAQVYELEAWIQLRKAIYSNL